MSIAENFRIAAALKHERAAFAAGKLSPGMRACRVAALKHERAAFATGKPSPGMRACRVRRINELISGTESTRLACAQRMKTLSIAADAICRNEVTYPG